MTHNNNNNNNAAAAAEALAAALVADAAYANAKAADKAKADAESKALLASCKEMVTLWVQEGGHYLKSDSPSIQRARAAIAAATAESKVV